MQDITIYLTDREGETHKLSAPTDMAMNLMEVIKGNDFPVEGTCGGMALCASCQCYITSDHALNPLSQDEEAMLAEAFHVEENSRLVCQLQITEKMDGLCLTLAPHEDD